MPETKTLLRFGNDWLVVRTSHEPLHLNLTISAVGTVNDSNLNYAQVKLLHETLGDWLDEHRLDTPGKTYDHDPRPDDGPESGDRCRTCGEDITWVGPSMDDWLHVDDEENR